MKFLVDAQLPRRFCVWLVEAGHEALHTLDLPQGNRTSDNEILDVAESGQHIVVTKDDDFVQSYLINGRPQGLLLVSTGITRTMNWNAPYAGTLTKSSRHLPQQLTLSWGANP